MYIKNLYSSCSDESERYPSFLHSARPASEVVCPIKDEESGISRTS